MIDIRKQSQRVIVTFDEDVFLLFTVEYCTKIPRKLDPMLALTHAGFHLFLPTYEILSLTHAVGLLVNLNLYSASVKHHATKNGLVFNRERCRKEGRTVNALKRLMFVI